MRRAFCFGAITYLISCFAASFAQSTLSAADPPKVSPESAFVSKSKYTNAFLDSRFHYRKLQAFPPSVNSSNHFRVTVHVTSCSACNREALTTLVRR